MEVTRVDNYFEDITNPDKMIEFKARHFELLTKYEKAIKVLKVIADNESVMDDITYCYVAESALEELSET